MRQLHLKSSHTHTALPGMLQLLYAYDLQRSQGLTVHEKSAHLRGTAKYYNLLAQKENNWEYQKII
jgi:hypothetical protein